jgi:uncharacterized PurR-regulated membrane protein YhhQ (DUF165 family)
VLVVFAFVFSAAAANISIAHFGPAAAPYNAFLLIGLSLSARDHLHDRWRGHRLTLKMLAMLMSAGIASYAFDQSSGRIAVASVCALVGAGITDTVVYHLMGGNRFIVRCNASNVVGGAVDSLLFFGIAFGAISLPIFLTQWAVKVFGGGIWSLIIARLRK